MDIKIKKIFTLAEIAGGIHQKIILQNKKLKEEGKLEARKYPLYTPLEDIISHLKTGKLVVSINKEGHIDHWNRYGKFFLKVDKDKILGYKPDQVVFRYYIPVIKDGEITHYERRNVS